MNKFKNIYTYIAIISALFVSANIDPEALTSWPILVDKLLAFISNPYQVGLFAIALITGVFNDLNTKGVDLFKFKK